MPADPSGVTTDDQGSPGNGADDRSPAATQDGRSASPSAAPTRSSGEPPATPAGGDGGQGRRSRGVPAPNGAAARPGQGDGSLPAAAIRPTGGTPPDAGTVIAPTPGHGAGEAVPSGQAPPDTDAGTASDPILPAGPLGPSAEPPPAPVLTGAGSAAGDPAGGRAGERRGRHGTARRDRASMRGLRINQRLWSVDPWSVFKLSALFYLCMALIVLVAGTLLYNAGRRVGTIDQFESFVTRMGAYGECVVRTELPEGADFEVDEDECGEDEVLVGGFQVDDGTLFRVAAVASAILVLAGSIGNVLMTVLVNLLNEVTGGLRHTVVKEPVARPPGQGQPRPGAARRRAATGSPPRQPQG